MSASLLALILGASHPKLEFTGPSAAQPFYSGITQFASAISFNWTFFDTGLITRNISQGAATTNPTQFLTPVAAGVGANCDVRMVITARSGAGTLRFGGVVIAPPGLGPTAWAPLTAEGVKLEAQLPNPSGSSLQLNATFSIDIRNRATGQVISRAGSLAMEVQVD